MNRRFFHHFRHIRSRSAPEPRYSSTDILLAGGAVGAWLAWFAIIFTFWFYGAARDRNVNYPDPIRFPVDKRLFVIHDTSETATAAPESGEKSVPVKSAVVQLNWWIYLDNGLAAAEKEHKPVLVDFMSFNCSSSMEMEMKTLADPEIRKRLADDWVCIHIVQNILRPPFIYDGRTLTNRGLAHYFHADKIPAFLFIDSTGNPVQTVHGFMGEKTFAALLDYMKNEVYAKKIPFEEYRRTVSSAGH